MKLNLKIIFEEDGRFKSLLKTKKCRQKMRRVQISGCSFAPWKGGQQKAQGVATRHESQTLGTNRVELEPRRGDQSTLARKRDRELILVAPAGLEFRRRLPGLSRIGDTLGQKKL